MPAARKNPFVIGHPASGVHLADRVHEVQVIATAFADSSSRLLVYGDRRLGKSSVVGVAAATARAAGTPVIVVDLAKVTSIEGAAQAILSALHKELGRRWRTMATDIVTRFRQSQVNVGAQPDPAGGLPTLTFSIAPGPDSAKRPGSLLVETLDAVEAEMAARKQAIGLALDEFQRLTKWETEIDWLLKGVFDAHRHVSYVLAGSQRSLIDAMIDSKVKGGLYKMVDILDVQPIPGDLFAPWITERAASTGVVFGDDVARAIIAVAGPRTRDAVQLARALWDMTHLHDAATTVDVEAALDDLVTEQGAHHQGTWDRFKTDIHRRILLLIAVNPKVELTASSTLKRYDLGAKTTVDRTLKTLIQEEHVVVARNGHRLDDPFFMRWIELNVFRELNVSVPSLRERILAALPPVDPT